MMIVEYKSLFLNISSLQLYLSCLWLFFLFMVYILEEVKACLLLDGEGVFMSHSKKRNSNKKGKKQHRDIAPVSQTENDDSMTLQQAETLKTKPFDEIIKGFREIEKIEHTDSASVSQSENDDSGKTKKNSSPKSKSYAEIIKGFQEIEKIISNSQIPE